MSRPRNYAYKITFKEIPHWYWGAHREKKHGERYLGSPVTHKWMWEFYTPQIQILEFFDTWEEAQEVECRLIRHDLNNPLCLNENVSGVMSVESCRLGGQISGAAMRDSGQLAEIGKTYGTMAMSEGGWLYENRVEYAKLGAAAAKAKGVGIFGLTSEDHRETALRNYANGVGLAGMTAEERKEASAKGGTVSGEKHKQNKTGLCGIPPEEHSARMSETNKQKWKCPECGYIGNARSVNRHMLEEHNLPKNAKVKWNGNEGVKPLN